MRKSSVCFWLEWWWLGGFSLDEPRSQCQINRGLPQVNRSIGTGGNRGASAAWEMLTQAMDSMGGTASLAPVSGRIPAVEGEGSRRRRPPSADAQGSEDPLAPRMIQLLEDDETFRERMREIFQADRQERREVNSAKRFARWMERLTTKLAEAELDGLSANQQADLEGILEEERQQVRSGFRRARRGELTWDEARDRAIKFREASNEKIKPILGDEQFAVFEEFRRRARGPR